MEQPTLCLLGRPAVLEEGRLTTLALRPKALALLAYLALAGGAVVRRDLAGLLFPDAGDPLATLRWHLAHIRSHSPRIVADHLDVRREAARLSIPTDVAIFCAAAARVQQRPDVPDAAAVFALFRDGFLAGVSVSGSAIPNFCASMRTASWNPTFSCSSRNLNTSPPTPQPKQWKNPLSRLTWNDGVFSPWNGHSPLKVAPDFFRET